MSENRIWAPWRLKYVKDAKTDENDGCIFCSKPTLGDDETALIIHRGEASYLMLNLYPYTSGHLLVSPYDHLGRIFFFNDTATTEMMDIARLAMNRLEDVYKPQGFNVGFNQGSAAGAGIPGHIHMHVVPRWGGDTNFMPVIADHRVMPQSLEDSYHALLGAFGNDSSPQSASTEQE